MNIPIIRRIIEQHETLIIDGDKSIAPVGDGGCFRYNGNSIFYSSLQLFIKN